RGGPRWYGERDCAWSCGDWRHRAPFAIRQHAQLRGVGRSGRDCRACCHFLLAERQQDCVGVGALMLSGGHLLSVLIFFPAAGALALMMLRGDDYKFIRAIAMLVSVAELLFSLLLLRGVPIGTSGYQLEEFAKWIPAPPIHYHLGVDGISMFLVLLTAFLTPISVLASWNSIQHRVKEFFVMVLMLVVVVVGVFLCFDRFMIFLFLYLILLPM